MAGGGALMFEAINNQEAIALHAVATVLVVVLATLASVPTPAVPARPARCDWNQSAST